MPDQSGNPYEASNIPPVSQSGAAVGNSDDLTPVDWLLIIFCSGIACIVGIVRLIQGKPSAAKMIGFSLISAVAWTLVRIAIMAALNAPGH